VSAASAPAKVAAPIRILETCSRWCNGVARAVVIGMMGVMSVVILVQVFLRYVVKASLPWSEELARYLMVWIGMMGASLALQEGRHIEVTLLLDRVPRSVRKILTGIALLAVLTFLGLILQQGLLLTTNIWLQRSPAMDLPMVIPYAAVPLGAVLMMIQVLLAFCRLLGPPTDGRERPGERPDAK
jgi:TRAP-type C4-dicarboxylate transport system permease small subunit